MGLLNYNMTKVRSQYGFEAWCVMLTMCVLAHNYAASMQIDNSINETIRNLEAELVNCYNEHEWTVNWIESLISTYRVKYESELFDLKVENNVLNEKISNY